MAAPIYTIEVSSYIDEVPSLFLKLETVKSYIQFIKNEKKLLDEQRSKVQEEAGVEDDGLDSLGSNRLAKNEKLTQLSDKVRFFFFTVCLIIIGDKS